jgi:hypothetical protein
MERFRRGTRRRIAASFACLAFVLQGLVPALAHAMASTARAQLYPGELCSVDPRGARLRLLQAIDDQAPTPMQPAPSAAHCPFCALPLGATGPAPAPFAWDVRDTGVAAFVPIVSADPPLLRPAQGRPQTPRAPPGA